MRKVLSALVCFMMVVSLIPQFAFADQEGSASFVDSEDTVKIKTLDGNLAISGYEIYRSTNKNFKNVKKAIFTTTNEAYNNKNVRDGQKYYYKVRGFVKVDGKKLYTGWSNVTSKYVTSNSKEKMKGITTYRKAKNTIVVTNSNLEEALQAVTIEQKAYLVKKANGTAAVTVKWTVDTGDVKLVDLSKENQQGKDQKEEQQKKDAEEQEKKAEEQKKESEENNTIETPAGMNSDAPIYTPIYFPIYVPVGPIDPIVPEKQTPEVTAPTANTLTYNGEEQELVTAGSTTGGTLKYALGDETPEESSYSTSIPKATNAGTYTVWYKVDGNEDYKDVAAQSVNVELNKRSVTLTSASASKPYDGTPLADGTVEVSGDGFLDGDGATYTVTGSQTVAGSSENIFTYSLNDGTNESNYSITKVEGDLTIAKVKVDVPSAVNNLVYNGGEQVGVTLPADAKYTLSDNKKTNAGSYTATAELNDKDNYEWDLVTPTSKDQTINWSIAKATPSAPEDIPYNGNKCLSDYSLPSGWNWNDENETVVEDNSYLAKYAGNCNYNSSEKKVTIYKPTCFAAGTKITMADGSLKNIEDVDLGDKVLTFNHQTGKFEAQEVNIDYVCQHPKKSFTLYFTNGIEISIVGEHDLFEKESMKYEMITDEDADSFIGKHFYNAACDRYEELLNITYNSEPVMYYSLYTKQNYNCIANNMLSLPDDVDEYLNIFEFKDDLTVDQEALQKDIEKFGIYEFTGTSGFTIEEYNEYNGKYLYIMIGKGLITFEDLLKKREEYTLDDSTN